MNGKHILITGGAGFIGSHLADELLNQGYRVRVLDSLDPQVHGSSASVPDYLSPDVDFVQGDVRDCRLLQKILPDVSVVVHLAAAVGVGQSMYEMVHYTSVNELGTATLLEALNSHPVQRLIVASSMSIYGEGLYRCSEGALVSAVPRSRQQLENGDWEVRADDGQRLFPVATPESRAAQVPSIYGLSKYVQERQSLIWGQAYGVPTTALRFFNVYGPRQALSNPYTGVLAIFASRYLSGQPPLVFEDGRQQRDFVHVQDVVRACRLALESESQGCEVFNIGSGWPVTICEVASELAQVLQCEQIVPQIIGRYRAGDIRHCFADISRAQRQLNYRPQVDFAQGLAQQAAWLLQQTEVDGSQVQVAQDELTQRGLVV